MWTEAYSALHERLWRGDLDRAFATIVLGRLEAMPVRPRVPRGLHAAAWRLADAFGWAKTYDAEYVALAELLGCRLLTLDGSLRRATARLGFVIGPGELRA